MVIVADTPLLPIFMVPSGPCGEFPSTASALADSGTVVRWCRRLYGQMTATIIDRFLHPYAQIPISPMKISSLKSYLYRPMALVGEYNHPASRAGVLAY